MRPLIVILCLCFAIPSFSQDSTNKQFQAELNLVMRKYSSMQKQLMAVRGSTPAAMRIDYDARLLQQRLNYWDPLFRKVGILIYEQGEKELNIYYLDNLQRQLKSKKAVTKLELQVMEQKLKRALGAELSLDSLGKRGGTSERRPEITQADIEVVNRLSEILLPSELPFASLHHLVIVPTNNIGAMPFSMFRINDTSVLIDKMSYSIVPSINEFIYFKGAHVRKFYSNENENGSHFNGDNIYFDSSEAVLMVANPKFTDPRFDFSDLPGSEKEVQAVKKHFKNAIVLKNENATKAAILKEIYTKNILYFATHGIASVKEPVFNNGLFLAGKTKSEVMWTYDEIIKLGNVRPLQAELVILSACQTGLGYARGAGIVSIARAFQISGADNVVMSLWNISDNKTPELMDLFFKYLHTPMEFQPFGALQMAIKEFKKTNPDPVYWAPFSLYGVAY
jgi:CHAT domain-containing protein